MAHPDASQLQGIPLFEGLTLEERTRLAGWLEVEDYDAGRSLVRADQHGYAFYVLAAGRAHAEVDGKALEVLEAGAVFGELAFFQPNSRRTATVVAETPVQVYNMFGTRFREMEAELPQVAQRLHQLVEERLRRVAAATATEAD